MTQSTQDPGQFTQARDHYNLATTHGSLRTTHLACVAWRFWLLINKGGQGQINREEIGAGATEKPAARTGGFFESVRTPAYGSFRLVQNARPSIKYFGNFPWQSFERPKISSRQKQNQNMAEALTRALSLLNTCRENSAIVLKPEQETPIIIHSKYFPNSDWLKAHG